MDRDGLMRCDGLMNLRKREPGREEDGSNIVWDVARQRGAGQGGGGMD